jgi:hypothetical protein
MLSKRMLDFMEWMDGHEESKGSFGTSVSPEEGLELLELANVKHASVRREEFITRRRLAPEEIGPYISVEFVPKFELYSAYKLYKMGRGQLAVHLGLQEEEVE